MKKVKLYCSKLFDSIRVKRLRFVDIDCSILNNNFGKCILSVNLCDISKRSLLLLLKTKNKKKNNQDIFYE